VNDVNSQSTSVGSLSEFAGRDRALWERIAADYCRKDLVSSTRIARRLRTRQSISAIPGGLQTAGGLPQMLEIGCGAGFAAEYLKGMYSEFCGVDYSQELIELARHRNADARVDFQVADIKTFTPGRQYDVIFAIGVLHHLDDVPTTLSHVLSLLRPGGWFIANEPSPANPIVSLARQIRKSVDANYSSEQRELTKQELWTTVTGAGFQDVLIKPQGVFSTPFAEVVLRPQFLTTPLSGLAALTDRCLESTLGGWLGRLSWNLIVAGRRP